MTKVFIDGSAGTTGLRIRERLAARRDLQLLTIPEQLRKDDGARQEFLNRADVAFLCLPDAAAIEAAEMVQNPEQMTPGSMASRSSRACGRSSNTPSESPTPAATPAASLLWWLLWWRGAFSRKRPNSAASPSPATPAEARR